MKKFLVVIDTQFDFVMPNGALYVKGAEEIIVPGIDFLANLNPAEYRGVLFTYDTHVPAVYEGSPESELFPIHCVEGTPGWHNVFNQEMINKLIPVYTLWKGVFNMWEEDGLELFHERRIGDVDDSEYIPRDAFFDASGSDLVEIDLFGVASDYCVKWAVDGFVKRGFKVNVIDRLCKGIQLTAQETFEDPEYASVQVI